MNLTAIQDYLAKKVATSDINNKWKGVVIHHSATVDEPIARSWEVIRYYHIKKNGWLDIGYHFGIERVDKKLEYLIGRDITLSGAHCLGLNNTHIGICLVGNYDLIEPSLEQYVYLRDLIRILMLYFNIVEVIGHREAIERLKNSHWKSCPGLKFDLKNFRKILVF